MLLINQWNSVNTDSGGRVTHPEANRDLRGTTPAELGNLSELGTLYLDANGLTGGIPAKLGDLSRLQALGLGNNRLTGAIPAELGDLYQPPVASPRWQQPAYRLHTGQLGGCPEQRLGGCWNSGVSVPLIAGAFGRRQGAGFSD